MAEDRQRLPARLAAALTRRGAWPSATAAARPATEAPQAATSEDFPSERDAAAPQPEEAARSARREWPSALEAFTLDAAFEVVAVAGTKGEDASEDAFNAAGHHVAVADGASSSWEAGRWAQALVDAWTTDRDAHQQWLASARQAFVAATPTSDGALAWLEDAAAQRGAYAAFLGVDLEAERDQVHWHAHACGDVTAIQLSADGVHTVFHEPSTHGFGSHPKLLTSLDEAGKEIDTTTGVLLPGQSLLLATDAVAEFLIARASSAELQALHRAAPSELAEVVRAAAREGRIEVDDLTLLRVSR